MLHELIEVRHLQLETGELLIQICVLLLRFSARHLQHDEALLGTLPGGVDTQLQTIAMALNLLAESLNHPLELINHGADGGIRGLSGSGTAGVVVWIRLHGSEEFDTKLLGHWIEFGK
jgi:hypothetical protein